jgi:predicted nucleic acid-binding protein
MKNAEGLIMKTGNYALDTNIVVALFKGERSVEEQLSQTTSVIIPIIVLEELFLVRRTRQNLRKCAENRWLTC